MCTPPVVTGIRVEASLSPGATPEEPDPVVLDRRQGLYDKDDDDEHQSHERDEGKRAKPVRQHALERGDCRRTLSLVDAPGQCGGARTGGTGIASEVPFRLDEGSGPLLDHEILLNWLTAMFTTCEGSGTKLTWSR